MEKIDSVTTPQYRLIYGQADITRDIAPYVLEIHYTDYLHGQSDCLEIRLEDRDGRWLRQWWPSEGDTLSLSLGDFRTGLIPAGAFEIDEIEYEDAPTVVRIKALGTVVLKSARTHKPKYYEKKTLPQIVGMVAGRLGLGVTGTIRAIFFERVTQYQERDIEFLMRLAMEYGHSFKIIGANLVFTDNGALAAQAASRVLDETRIKHVRLKDRIRRLPSNVVAQGFDRDKKEVVSSAAGCAAKRSRTSADSYQIVTRVDNPAQIAERAKSAKQDEEDDQCSGTISMVGDATLAAGLVVHLPGRGKFSGDYLINEARHSMSKIGGYVTELNVKMVRYTGEQS